MNQTLQQIGTWIILLFMVAAFGWFAWWRLQKSRDKGAFVVRWVVTGFLIFVILRWVAPAMVSGSILALAGLVGSLLIGLVLAAIWTPEIIDSVSRKIGSLYDGGDEEVDPKPFYSVAQAQRTHGHYQRALDETRKQLEKFPNDFEGQMLLASIQAENLNDLPGAVITIQRLCAQEGHPPGNIAYALSHLADWHLKIEKDRDAAKRAFEQIIAIFPDSELAVQAAARIGRLADTETLLSAENRRPVVLHKGVDNIGLLMDQHSIKPVEENPETITAAYVKHLEQNPLDSHIRERLALLYANHYQRMDLAIDQFEQLIQLPHQPVKQVVQWLNMLTDLQLQHGFEHDRIRETLQRIVDLNPNAAAAENARRRMDILRLEMKSAAKSAPVQMGTYEQNIGLKRSS